MSHLLAIAVGPVQEFIAAARRTRDLWFGSYLLSEISRAVAKTVGEQGKLIFPASVDAENIANVILAELDGGNPKETAAKAKEAAQNQWLEFADKAYQEVPDIIRSDIWHDQVNDVIEFYAAWATRSADYRADRARLMRLLTGRKNCRDFLSAKGRGRIPKSSLDGQRETVLKDGDRADWPKKLRVSPGEQLDAVAVAKRLGKKKGEPDPRYPSVARVAAETWLSGKLCHAAFSDLKIACEQLVPHGLHRVTESCYEHFPFEGTIIYEDRHGDLIDELGWKSKPDVLKLLKQVKELLVKLEGEPLPYLAVLIADGDKMGAAISALTSANANRDFSQALAGFANEARKIVSNHNGVLVYAGGDDVLAFLPVIKCLSCARKLHDKFGELLGRYKNEEGQAPTLSVGIAIGHFMENLEDLLDYGRAAEKAAKKVEGKDALAVHLHKRGGSPIKVRAKWSAGEENKIILHQGKPRERAFDLKEFNERLLCYAELILIEAIPSKLPYDLRKLADLYKGWRSETEDNISKAMAQDTLRVIRDKQPRSGQQYMPEIEKIINTFNKPDDLEQFAKQLLVSRQIATALRQAEKRQAPVTEAAI